MKADFASLLKASYSENHKEENTEKKNFKDALLHHPAFDMLSVRKTADMADDMFELVGHDITYNNKLIRIYFQAIDFVRLYKKQISLNSLKFKVKEIKKRGVVTDVYLSIMVKTVVKFNCHVNKETFPIEYIYGLDRYFDLYKDDPIMSTYEKVTENFLYHEVVCLNSLEFKDNGYSFIVSKNNMIFNLVDRKKDSPFVRLLQSQDTSKKCNNCWSDLFYLGNSSPGQVVNTCYYCK